MQTVGQIIRSRREALGLTLAAVAQAVGTTKSYLSMIENHRTANPPSRRLLEALEGALKIGDGALCQAADWQNTPDPVRRRYEQALDAARRGRRLADWLRRAAHQRGDGTRDLDKLFQSGELTRQVHDANVEATRMGLRFDIPLINRVAAGYPSDFTDLDYPARVADGYVACPDLIDPQAFAARVVGDSMLPQYAEGDVVIFSPDAGVSDGCDCFVRLEPDHETTFKRVFFEGDDGRWIRLEPLNRAFAPRTVEREQVAGLYRAVWRLRGV